MSIKKMLCAALPVVAGGLLSMTSAELAVAGGGQAYPNGAEAFMIGAAPPPGFHFINYLYYYSADELTNAKGKNSGLLDDATVLAEVARFIWISNYQILGANYGQHLFLLATDREMDFKVPVGPNLKKHYHSTDAPYVIWAPFLLTWHLMQGQLHVVFDLADIYVPLSNEDKNDLSSMGRNYWTFEPVLAATWMPTPELEFSVKLMYDINTRQDDYCPGPPVLIDRTPGDEFHMDFGASYAVMPNLRVGLNGYYYRQLEDDDFHGMDAYPSALRSALSEIEGEQGQVWALGPGIMYQHKNFMATLRGQWEFESKNRPEGQNVWFKVIYSF